MHVIAEGRHSVEHLNNVPAKIPRMRRREPNPRDSVHLTHRRQQLGKTLLSIRIAIGIDVLPEQLNLGVSKISQLPCLREHRSRSAAPLLPASEWHHAVGAKLVAALDDGDVSAMRIRTRRVLGLK